VHSKDFQDPCYLRRILQSEAGLSGFTFRRDIRGDPFSHLPIYIVGFAPTEWAGQDERAGARHFQAPTELGLETWRHVDEHLAAGGCVVFTCVRTLTRSVLAMWLWMMLGRRELPFERAMEIIHQHNYGRLDLLDCRDTWVLTRASTLQLALQERYEVSTARAAALRSSGDIRHGRRVNPEGPKPKTQRTHEGVRAPTLHERINSPLDAFFPESGANR